MGSKTTGVFFFLFLSFYAAGQGHRADTSQTNPATAEATTTFRQVVQLQKEIYTGAEHIGYAPNIQGVAYFLQKEWLPGSVLYDGILYENESLMYDQVKDKLVVKRFDGFGVELRSEKISYFTLPGHTFVYIPGGFSNGLKEGFYEQLAAGPLSILARRAKVVEEQMDVAQLRQQFVATTAYYALKGNTVHGIKNKASLLALADGKKSELQQHLRKKGINFKQDREQALIAVAGYYNQIQR
jgi:hypothetical protein